MPLKLDPTPQWVSGCGGGRSPPPTLADFFTLLHPYCVDLSDTKNLPCTRHFEGYGYASGSSCFQDFYSLSELIDMEPFGETKERLRHLRE